MTDLVSLVVHVRPAEITQVPANLGRAVYALFLRWLAEYDAELSQYWHDAEGMKPFSCSSLIGGQRAGRDVKVVDPDSPVWFRLTALNADIASALLSKHGSPPETVDLDGTIMQVESLTINPEEHEWANATDYQTLAKPYLLPGQSPPSKVHMRFASPTFFRQQNMTTAIPLPDLVFGNLTQRWNMFTTVAVSDAVRDYAHQCIAMSRYRLRSQVLLSKNAIPQVGGVGRATYVGVKFDRYWMSVVALLSDYAFYAGVGRSTTAGGGQARRITSAQRRSNEHWG